MVWVQLGHSNRENEPAFKGVILFPRVDEIDKNHFCVWLFISFQWGKFNTVSFTSILFLTNKCQWNDLWVNKKEYHNLLEKLDRFFWKFKYQENTVLGWAVLSRISCVWLFVTPWTEAHQGPLSMGFSRQEHWGGLPSSVRTLFLSKLIHWLT